MAEAVLNPGVEIGGCRVLEKLGAGAMGTVFKAHHIALDKLVALKVLNNNWSGDATFVDRFQREARAAAKIDHPNVVQVYNVGQDSGHYYIVMQFVEGESLQDLVEREKKLSLTAATRIIRAIALALAEAHGKNVVHRDIKTANILIGKDDRPLLTDFGLARNIEPDKGLTVPGTIMGTPGYIAPEVIEGKPADFGADQYALGVAYYYLLSGTLPHKGKTAYEIFSKQLTGRPPPLVSLAPEVPAPIAELVHKLMSRNPEDRFASMRAFVDQLDAVWRSLSLEQKERRSRLLGSAVGWVFLAGAFALAAILAVSAVDAVERGIRMNVSTPFSVPFSMRDPRWLPRAATVLLAVTCFSCFFLFGRDQFSRSGYPILSFLCLSVSLAGFYVDGFRESLQLVPVDSLGQRWKALWPLLAKGGWTRVNGGVLGLSLTAGAFLFLLRENRRWIDVLAGLVLAFAGSALAYRFALLGVQLYYPEADWRIQLDSFNSVLLAVFVVGIGVAGLGPVPRSSGVRLLSGLFLGLSLLSIYSFGALAASSSAVRDLGWEATLALPLRDLGDQVFDRRGFLGISLACFAWGGILFYLPRPRYS